MLEPSTTVRIVCVIWDILERKTSAKSVTLPAVLVRDPKQTNAYPARTYLLFSRRVTAQRTVLVILASSKGNNTVKSAEATALYVETSSTALNVQLDTDRFRCKSVGRRFKLALKYVVME